MKVDFPRVPYPKYATQFWQLVLLGGKLRQLHLLEGAVFSQLTTGYPESGSNKNHQKLMETERQMQTIDQVLVNV